MMTAGKNTQHLDDETLVAYADGTLEPEEAQRVERILEQDEEARQLVELLRKSAELSVEAFKEAVDTPPPRHLVDTILGDPSEGTGNVVSLASEKARRGSLFRLALPIAASVAILIAGVAGLRLLSPELDGLAIATGPVEQGSSLGALLETAASGETRQITLGPGEADVSVMATFLDRDQRHCREVEAIGSREGAQTLTIAVACRSSEGQWVVEGATQQVAATPNGQGFTPAGGDELPEFQELLQRLGAGPALPAAVEQERLSNGWK